MNLKEEIKKYLLTTKRKRRAYYFMTKEKFWISLEKELINLKIDEDWKMERKIWHFMKGTNEIPKCHICNIKNAKWQYYKYDYGCCSASCAGKQSMNTISKNIGVDNQFQLESVKIKSKNTLLKKYGVDNISKLESIKIKKEETMLINYGRTNNMGNNCEIMYNNMMRIYGVGHSSHIPELADEMQFNRFKKRHLVITPSGKKIFLQGYEPNGYSLLLNEGYKEIDILYRKVDMPKIMYYYEGMERRYYPDFFIEKENLIIEIKCKYTYEIEKDKNDIKFTSTKQLGYNHRLIII
jgi:hypothetical protein